MVDKMNSSHQEIAKLSRALVEFAQQLLEKQGDFLPFAMTMDEAGSLAMFGADIGSEHPEATKLFTFLSGAMRSRFKQGGVRAWGICLNVGARLPGYADQVDAICCQMEHSSMRPVQVFVPFHKNHLGRLEYDKPVTLPGQSSQS